MAGALARRRRRAVEGARQNRSLLHAWPKAPAAVATVTTVSRQFGPWIERARRLQAGREARAAFEADVAAGRDTFDLLTIPLLPYQREGMLHLAFGERALLADDMGLGKTIQAIAACELLAPPQAASSACWWSARRR